jgi:hypothetical protein
MRFIRKTLLILLAAALVPGVVWAASFTASLDRDAMVVGETAALSLTFEGAQPRTVPTPRVAGLQFTQAGTSQNVSIVNGAMTSTVTISFQVTAQRAGEYVIPAMTADLNGQPYSSQPIKLSVGKVTAPTAESVNSGNEVAFLKFVLPKTKLYVGEPVIGKLELYLREDVQNFGNFQMTSSPTEGFSAGKITELQNQRRRVQIGNRIYNVIPLAIPLSAVRSGPLTLGPFTANAAVVLPSQNQGGDPFFRQFFNQGEQKQVMLTTEPFAVESVPLPKQGKPANFAGAVGDFRMTSTAGPTDLTAGDPITVRVQITGHGTLDAVSLPVQEAWHAFKTYPPTAKLETTDQFGFQGTKTFEQIISPQNSDVHELPALTFSYFNPDDGQYHTLTEPAVPITVKAAGTSPMPALAANKSAASENQTPQDILPIKEKLGTFAAPAPPLVTRPVFLAAQVVPVLALLAAFVWRKRADSLANNPRLRRQRAVAQVMAMGLSDLKKHAAANQPDDFFATLFRLLQEQLGERLDCPATAITEDVIESHAALRQAPQALRTALHEQFQLCNQARYAPVRGVSELNSVAAQFEKLIAQLQEVKG